MFQNLSGWHFVILLVIILLLFGAPRLPALARSLGQSFRILKGEVRRDDDTAASGDASAAPAPQQAAPQQPAAQPPAAPPQQPPAAAPTQPPAAPRQQPPAAAPAQPPAAPAAGNGVNGAGPAGAGHDDPGDAQPHQ